MRLCDAGRGRLRGRVHAGHDAAGGRDTLSEEDFGRGRSPDDLPGYHYFPSGLKFPTTGIWVLELDTGKVVGTIVVNVEGPEG